MTVDLKWNIILSRERVYALMLIFILLVNVIHRFGDDKAIEVEKGAFLQELQKEDLVHVFRQNKILTLSYFALMLLGTGAFLLGLMVLAAFGISCYKKVTMLPRININAPVPWNIIDVCNAVIVYLFFGYVLTIFEWLVFSLFEAKEMIKQDWFGAMNALLMDAVIVLFIFTVVRTKYKINPVALGIVGRKWLQAIFLGIGGYIGFIPILLATAIVSLGIMKAAGIEISPHPLVPMIFEERSWVILGFLAVLACVLGPLCEEVFFRGFAYPALRKKFGMFWSMILVSIFFAIIHANAYAFIPIMALSMLLVYLYERTGSLWVPVTVHIIHNSVMMIGVGFYKYAYTLSQNSAG